MNREPNAIKAATVFAWFLVLVIGALACMTLITLERAGQNVPALVGYNCEGATGPIFANDESDFPECERIERTR